MVQAEAPVEAEAEAPPEAADLKAMSAAELKAWKDSNDVNAPPPLKKSGTSTRQQSKRALMKQSAAW